MYTKCTVDRKKKKKKKRTPLLILMLIIIQRNETLPINYYYCLFQSDTLKLRKY